MATYISTINLPNHPRYTVRHYDGSEETAAFLRSGVLIPDPGSYEVEFPPINHMIDSDTEQSNTPITKSKGFTPLDTE